jgi:itaconate CoA-transferase
MSHEARSLPLSGINVVSIEQAIAAPLASRHLADWGARVIKIERPGGGDFCRDYDSVVNGLSSQFLWTNRSKESLAIDIKDPKGREALDALLAKADIFIQNLAPGAAKRQGLDAASLVERFPRLIACDVSGYGSSGPYSKKKAYDLLVQCEAGLLSVNGTEKDMAKVGLSIVDIATGMYVLNGALMALFHRERTGKGLAFEVSLFDAITEWMSYPALYTEGAGKPLRRTGARHATIAPYGPFRTGDGKEVFFGVQNEREWVALCSKGLGDADLAVDPRFNSNPQRMENRDALQEEIERRFANLTAAQVLQRLDEAAIANANLNNVEQFLHHEQLHSRGRVRKVGSAFGPVTSYLPAVTIEGIEPVMGPVPAVGEHNAAILTELGLFESVEP